MRVSRKAVTSAAPRGPVFYNTSLYFNLVTNTSTVGAPQETNNELSLNSGSKTGSMRYHTAISLIIKRPLCNDSRREQAAHWHMGLPGKHTCLYKQRVQHCTYTYITIIWTYVYALNCLWATDISADQHSIPHVCLIMPHLSNECFFTNSKAHDNEYDYYMHNHGDLFSCSYVLNSFRLLRVPVVLYNFLLCSRNRIRFPINTSFHLILIP
jgi:hypothetical protein